MTSEPLKELGDVQTPATVEGFFGLNKPRGISSQKAVQVVKYWAREKTGDKKVKVGHGGTLDPLAQGVLVIAVGRAFTRQIDSYVVAHKEYLATIEFGSYSSTDDAEGEREVIEVVAEPTQVDVSTACQKFIGKIEQVPPVYSAIKIDGQEAYKRARKGEELKMSKRSVEIFDIDIVQYKYPYLEIRVKCGKGVYIRSLARDIGKDLGVGGYLTKLVRTRVGEITLEDCRDIQSFSQKS